MGEAAVQFTDFVEMRYERKALTVINLAARLNTTRTTVYNWLNENRWPRGVVNELGEILSFEIVRVEGMLVELRADGEALQCTVSGWIEEKNSRLRPTREGQTESGGEETAPPAGRADTSEALGTLGNTGVSQFTQQDCLLEVEFRGRLPPAVVAQFGPYVHMAELVRIVRITRGAQ